MYTNQSKKVDIDALISENVTLLKENLERYPSFDPTKPYNEKNEYFIELSRRGGELFSQGLHWAAELYFAALLEVIVDYEQIHNKSFNKGMAYANLGIAQMAIGKFDAGIAHLLTAGEEDRPIVPDYDILNTHLWLQFENSKIFDYLVNLNTNPDAGLGFTVNKTFLSNLVWGMEQQDRIFFEGTIWILQDNLHQHQLSSNVYTRGRLYSGLKDLCLLTESLLRKKQIANGKITTTSSDTLYDLIIKGPGSQGLRFPQNKLQTKAKAGNIQEFLNNLEYILQKTASAQLRHVYCLYLVRNFTGHHFDLSETVKSPNGKTFFDMYEVTLTNILSAIMYFKHTNSI